MACYHMRMRVVAFCAAFLASCAVPALVAAQLIPTIVPECNGPNCSVCDLVKLAQNIINAGIYISIFMSALFFAYAGWLYVSSGFDDVGSVTKAKSIFKNVAIGLIVILGAWLIVDTIVRGLVQSEYLPWTSLCR